MPSTRKDLEPMAIWSNIWGGICRTIPHLEIKCFEVKQIIYVQYFYNPVWMHLHLKGMVMVIKTCCIYRFCTDQNRIIFYSNCLNLWKYLTLVQIMKSQQCCVPWYFIHLAEHTLVDNTIKNFVASTAPCFNSQSVTIFPGPEIKLSFQKHSWCIAMYFGAFWLMFLLCF